jgi:hypothetical protein
MTKPKIPIYPRPVSPLTAEPLQSNLSDIFLDDSSDSYSDDEQRTTKRRRIEKLGEQYLRGDGLFIMTAGLKGLLTGWVNPWSKKHEQKVVTRAGTSRQDTREEVPETALKVPERGRSVVPARPISYDFAREPFLQDEIDKGTLDGDENWLKRAQDRNGYTSCARYDSPTPTRRCGKLGTLDHLMSARKVQHLTRKPQAVSADSRLPAAILKQPMPDKKLGPTSTMSTDTKQNSRVEIHSFTSPRSSRSDVPAALLTTKLLPIQPEPAVVEQRDARTTNTAAEDRMLNHDWNTNRRSRHKILPSTNLPEFEYRPVADSLKPMLKVQKELENFCRNLDVTKNASHLDFVSSADAPNGPCQVPTSGQADLARQAVSEVATDPVTLEKQIGNPSFPLGKMLPPLLSTQTSTTTNTNAMPSAQVVPAVQPHSTESYPSTEGKMIEPEVTPTDNKVGAHPSPSAEPAVAVTNKQHEARATVITKSTTPDTNWTNPNYVDSMQRPRSRGDIFPFSAFKSPPVHIAMAELDTQQMLAAITPLGFSTVKKVPLKPINAQTPATATRVKHGKQKKRTSFAAPPAVEAISSGSSQSSIKGNLKVSKMVSRETKAEESLERQSQPFLFGKLGLDMETSDEDGGPREEESLLGLSSLLQGKPHPQGGPVSSGPLPTANTMTSTSSAQQQDAQQQFGRRQEDEQNGGEGRDDFNLASAIDDLGSFLGTWDADKEAKEIGSVARSSCMKSALKSKSSTASVRT